MRTTPASQAMGPAQAIRLAVWAGLITAAGELAHAGLRKFVHHTPLFRPPDIVWMTPLMTASLFAGVTLFIILLDRGRGRWLTGPIVMGTCITLGLLSGLWLLPRIHRAASLLLAVGVGLRLAAPAGRHLSAIDRWARRSIPLLGGMAFVAALLTIGGGWLLERRATATLGPARAGAPNVLLIILDTVRAMSLSLYDYSRPTTPALEQFASRGVLFTRAISPAPWTLPSHASVFTGREAHELSTDWFVPLDDTYPTLAEQLRGAGYLTAGFSANAWYASREMGLGRGFIHFDDYRRSPTEVALSASIVRVLREAAMGWLGREDNLPDRKSAAEVNAAFLRWLDGRGNRPFFAFLNYYDAHAPYLPPEPFAGRFQSGKRLLAQVPKRETADTPIDSAGVLAARDAYDAAIAYLDHELGRLLASLGEEHQLENTIVIITADHGEEFMEHGLAEHGNSLYLPSVHVPLVVAWPGRVPTGIRVTTPVSLRQLPATVMELAGLGSASPLPGPSLVPDWSGSPDGAQAPPIYNQVGRTTGQPDWYPVSKGDMFAVLAGGLRYIQNGDGTAELYDFDRDAAERLNLVGDSALGAARQRLTALVEAIQPTRP
jgi:arylsulfatase A-like enzyme